MRDGKADFECSEFSYTPGEKGVRVYRFRPSVDLSFDNMNIVLDALGGAESIVKKMGIDKIVIRRSLVNLVFKKPINDCSVLAIDMAENQIVRMSTTGGGIRQEIDRTDFSTIEEMSNSIADTFDF